VKQQATPYLRIKARSPSGQSSSFDRGESASILVFKDQTGQQVDFNLSRV
jgi:hypothetical protein